jgi:hypothetical protein
MQSCIADFIAGCSLLDLFNISEVVCCLLFASVLVLSNSVFTTHPTIRRQIALATDEVFK